MGYWKKKYNKQAAKNKKYKAQRKIDKTAAKLVKKIVKNEINKVVETKIADFSFNPLGQLTSLYHNTWYRFETDPFTMYQGTSDSEALNPINRIGDSIYAKSISFTINLATYTQLSTVQYRFVLLKIKTGASMPGNITNHLQNVNNLITPIDRENEALISVIMDKRGWMINHGQTSAGGGDGERQLLHFNFKINKKLKYNEGAPGNASFLLQPYILVFDRQQTSPSGTPICDFQYFRRFYFQDA